MLATMQKSILQLLHEHRKSHKFSPKKDQDFEENDAIPAIQGGLQKNHFHTAPQYQNKTKGLQYRIGSTPSLRQTGGRSKRR